MRIKTDFREEELYPLWENFCKSKSWSKDLRLQGLRAGKLNLFEGPDFQGAEFELDGKIYYGDVEIHRMTNDWYHHHHHLDRRYNSVRLHLVWQQQPEVSVYTSDQQHIITLDINNLPRSKRYQKKIAFCRISQLSPNSLRTILRHLSLRRLYDKITRVKDLVNACSYDQVIYILLMRSLGSPNNASNFEYFASVLPWEKMTKIKKTYHLSSDQWIKFYIHLSGIKKIRPRTIDNTKNNQLSKLVNMTPPLSGLNWQTAGQRPRNNPISHLKILANWFFQFSNESLYFTLKDLIIQRHCPPKLILKFQDILSPSFSTSHDLNKSEIRKNRVPSWGKSKINEIIGNVIIPFFYWEASLQSSFGFQKYLEEFYFSLPQFNQYAKLKDLKLLISKSILSEKKFYIDQGLLYLHQYCCKNATCDQCLLEEQLKDIDKNF